MDIHPLTLAHHHARLEPLTLAHFDDLTRFIVDDELWQFMAFGRLDTPEKLRGWMEAAIQEPDKGTGLPFAIVDIASGQAVGSTSLYDISHVHAYLEIGRTWLSRPYQRTAMNTECKYLLLHHAFETLGCNRVQIKTDSRNLRSQAAIERLGAKKEGVLRSHMVMPDGYLRDTMMYSVIATEWPEVKRGLEERMARYEQAK